MRLTFFVSQPGSWDGTAFRFEHLNLVDFFEYVSQRPEIDRLDLCLPIRRGHGAGTEWMPTGTITQVVHLPYWRDEVDLLKRLPILGVGCLRVAVPSIRSADMVGATLPGLTGAMFLTLGHLLRRPTFAIVRGFPRRTLKGSRRGRLGGRVFPAAMWLLELYGALLIRRGTLCIPIAAGLERQLKAQADSRVITPVLDPMYRLASPRPQALGSRMRILYVGRLSGEKNLNLLIEALKLVDDDKSWTMTIAGSGPENERLRGLTDKLLLSSRITFLGPVNHGAELRDVYLQHDVFVLPSSTEGAPQALAEAMGMGLCPLVSAVGGMPDMIGEPSVGWLLRDLTPPGIAAMLRRVLTEWRPLTDRSQRAWEASAGMTFPIAAEALMEVLSDLTARPFLDGAVDDR